MLVVVSMLTGTDPPNVVAWASSTRDRLWAELEAVLRHRTTEAAPRLELFEIRAWGLPLDSTVSAYVRFEWLNAEPAAPPPTSALLVAGGEEGWHARRAPPREAHTQACCSTARWLSGPHIPRP